MAAANRRTRASTEPLSGEYSALSDAAPQILTR